MPETPTDPAGTEPAAAAAAAPTEPVVPVALDLTNEAGASSVTPGVQSALAEFANRAGESVDDVVRKASSDATKELGEQVTDREPKYAPRDRAQDSARQIITLWLIGLFCVLITLAFAALFMIGLQSGFNQGFFEKLKSLLDVLLGPVITLLSSAIGFYFGYQQGAGTLTRDGPKDGPPPKPGSGQ